MARTGTPFSGLAGEMFSRTVSIGALFTGLIFLAVIMAVAEYAPRGVINAVVIQLIFTVFVAHFAVEGYSDQWERAGRTIPPAEVGIVSLRYLALSVLALVPLFVAIEWLDVSIRTVLESEGLQMLAALYVLALAALPPALLVIAVSASSWPDVLSPAHWGSKFNSRWMDFLLIYAIFAGALICVVVAGLPILVYARTQGENAVRIAGEALTVFAIGFSISLLGRLCGSFAAPLAPEAGDSKPAPLHPTLVQFKGVAPAASDAAAPAPPAADAAAPRKAALLDAGARVDELRATHANDPAALVDALRELDDTYLPHPSVRQGLAIALVAAGRQQEAIDVAREAIPMCMKTGNVVAAALMYETLLASGETFGLGKEQIGALGDALRSVKRYASAAKVYGAVLGTFPGDIKAMKGLIAVAQTLAQQQETANAVRIYDYLLAHGAGSPLLDFVNTERAKLERKAG